MDNIQNIYYLFLESPYLNGCLIFEDGDFQGLLLKKDLEQLLKKEENFFLDKIITIEKNDINTVENIIFNEQPNLRMKIPYINLKGQILGKLLYDEFVSEFSPDDFQTKLSIAEILNYHEHPTLILNRFKTVLYLNNTAKELLSKEALGKKISEILLAFDIGFENNNMIVKRQEESWNLMISDSHSPHSSYQIYQFILLSHKIKAP